MRNQLYIIWDNKYELGIPIIDEQHRAIISTINTLHHFIMNKKERDVLDSTLIILGEYTKFHFLTEEYIMQEEGYPELGEHKKLHAQLAMETNRVSSKIKFKQDPSELLKFLKGWWLNHICIEDRKYADVIAGKE